MKMNDDSIISLKTRTWTLCIKKRLKSKEETENILNAPSWKFWDDDEDFQRFENITFTFYVNSKEPKLKFYILETTSVFSEVVLDFYLT